MSKKHTIEYIKKEMEKVGYTCLSKIYINNRKWFTPTCSSVILRIQSINLVTTGENRFYCSGRCKRNCSIFGRKKYPKEFKKDHSRPNQAEWRQLVLERDNHTCQKCGSRNNIEAHHIEGIYENPLESADIDLGITYCNDCHKEAHKDKGCRYVDLTRKNYKIGGICV